MSRRKRLFADLMILVLAGLIAFTAVSIGRGIKSWLTPPATVPECTECGHCKTGGWCCCRGTCKPKCNCPNCSCSLVTP